MILYHRWYPYNNNNTLRCSCSIIRLYYRFVQKYTIHDNTIYHHHHQQQQQQQLLHHKRLYFSIQSNKSYGPVLKVDTPSSRKVWRDRQWKIQKQILYQENNLLLSDDDDNDNENRNNVDNNSIDEPRWILRFQNAQLRYPTSSSTSNTTTSTSFSKQQEETMGRRSMKLVDIQQRRRLLHQQRRQQQQHQRKRLRSSTTTTSEEYNNDSTTPKTIYHIDQLEIRANMKPNAIKSRNTRYGTGHVILGCNGTGKSLLLNAILYNYCNNINMNTTSQQEGTDNAIGYEGKDNVNGTSSIDIQRELHYKTNPYLVDPSTLQFQGIPNTKNNTLQYKDNDTVVSESDEEKTTASTTFPTIAYVSFESHQELLDMGGTVWSILTKTNMGGGQLTKGMQYLVVRFGLYPLLTRDVTTLSTGEIRKVMIISAIAQQPQLLILDNAFDGLDTPSRKILKDMIIKTLNGFQKADTLVQGISNKHVTNNHINTQHYTQVLLVTHRHEEICDEISRITFLHPPKNGIPISTERRLNRTNKELVYESVGQEPLELGIATLGQFARKDNLTGIHDEPWRDRTLPTEDEILHFWNSNGNKENLENGKLIIQARHFHISRNDKDLISGLNWKMNYGERWWFSGLNGAGKSTLSKYLITSILQQQQQQETDDSTSNITTDDRDESFLRVILTSSDVNYISTERHMSLTKSNDVGQDVIRGLNLSSTQIESHTPSTENIHTVMKWLRIPKKLLLRPFNQLSQGEQKMLLIAGIISFRPSLLILDEALQGLDIVNRHRVMGVVERICSTTENSLIYVTHHYEDLIPSLTHVLHLDEGKAAFKGTVETFDCHNTLWSNKIKFVPESERELNEDGTIKSYDMKKKRKRRVW